MIQTVTIASSAQKEKVLMTNAASRTLVKILLVEDSESDAELMTEELKEGSLDLEIKRVVDGEEALDYLQTNAERTDLILLDLRLPKMSGHEVLRHLKKDPNLRRIPVVILTGHYEGIAEAWDDHANCCVAKPSDLDEFAKAVQKIESFWINVASRARGT